jgi:hypothetical protein
MRELARVLRRLLGEERERFDQLEVVASLRLEMLRNPEKR